MRLLQTHILYFYLNKNKYVYLRMNEGIIVKRVCVYAFAMFLIYLYKIYYDFFHKPYQLYIHHLLSLWKLHYNLQPSKFQKKVYKNKYIGKKDEKLICINIFNFCVLSLRKYFSYHLFSNAFSNFLSYRCSLQIWYTTLAMVIHSNRI